MERESEKTGNTGETILRTVRSVFGFIMARGDKLQMIRLPNCFHHLRIRNFHPDVTKGVMLPSDTKNIWGIQ